MVDKQLPTPAHIIIDWKKFPHAIGTMVHLQNVVGPHHPIRWAEHRDGTHVWCLPQSGQIVIDAIERITNGTAVTEEL